VPERAEVSNPARTGRVDHAHRRDLGPALEATRALRLGFAAENTFDEIIRVHIDDELGVPSEPRPRQDQKHRPFMCGPGSCIRFSGVA
jgi:hypothetical protein